MLSVPRLLSLTVVLASASACAHGNRSAHDVHVPAVTPAALITALGPLDTQADDALELAELACERCGAVPLPPTLVPVVERRLAELKARGGACSQYGSVLESSFRRGRIAVRPFMWRVGRQLVSGEAKPTGEMTLAMEIDSLNVGVRTVDEVIWSMEHEAAHIAFDIVSGTDGAEERANRYVRACRT